MPQPLSNDLRERVVAFVEAGNSCNEAARHFDTSVSFAVNLMALFRETGSVEPRAIGGKRHGKLEALQRDSCLDAGSHQGFSVFVTYAKLYERQHNKRVRQKASQ